MGERFRCQKGINSLTGGGGKKEGRESQEKEGGEKR